MHIDFTRSWRLLVAVPVLSLFSLAPLQATAGDGCGALAGGMTTDIGPVCLHNGAAILTATSTGTVSVPDGFLLTYLLTRTNGLVIEQISSTPSFSVGSVDIWRIHALVYDPLTLDLGTVQFGTTGAYDVQSLLVQGGGDICGSLDISGAPVKTNICAEPCAAHASGMQTDIGPICLVNGQATLTAIPSGTSTVPPGYLETFVLTRTNGLIIEQVSSTPSFTVNSVDVWRIHDLVYDPATLDLSTIQPGVTGAYDIQSLLVQGGGSICASLDISGAPVKTAVCEMMCTADAGSISANNPDLCLLDSVSMHSTADGNAIVPAGYEVLYVLTEGNDLTIEAISSTPSFTVYAPGLYTMHTLVYDPGTLDLSVIVPGTTTAFDVIALLQQGGGSICASLDVNGAQFQVTACAPLCTASAGTLSAEVSDVCLVNGNAILAAFPNGDAVVPDGYVVAYVLTQGSGLLIRNIEPGSIFDWPLTGGYTIHTLVYDPNTLDLSVLQLDASTALDLNALLIQGGGSICASLDLDGAPFTISQCAPPCNAGESASVVACFTDDPFDLFSILGGDPCPGGFWSSPNGAVFNGVFDPAVDVPGVFVYVITGPNGAETSMVTVDVIECAGNEQMVHMTKLPFSASASTGIHEAGAGTLGVWPNPAASMVQMRLPFAPDGGTRIELFDATGRCVAAPLSFNGDVLVLNVASLAPGAWTVRIANDAHVLTGRFVRSAE